MISFFIRVSPTSNGDYLCKRQRGRRQREDEIYGVVDLSFIFLGLRSPKIYV